MTSKHCRVGANWLELRWRNTERQPSSAEFPIHKYKCIATGTSQILYVSSVSLCIFWAQQTLTQTIRVHITQPHLLNPFIYKLISQTSLLLKHNLQLCYKTENVNISSLLYINYQLDALIIIYS